MDITQKVINLAIEIQQIPAPTFQEEERANFIFEKFQSEGLSDVSIDNLNNVYGRLQGLSRIKPLIVTAHLDTVFPLNTNLKINSQNNKILGPGIGDNSLGVAGLFGLLWNIKEKNTLLPGDIWFVANVREEGLGDLEGMRAVVKRFSDKPRAFLVLEGMGQGIIYTRGLGVKRYRITAKAKGGHSWVDFGSPSAIHEIVSLSEKITKLNTPSDPRTSLNIGKIRGGTSINTIASEASIELDLRSEKSETLKALAAQVENLVAISKTKGIDYEIEEIGDRPSGEISNNHPLVTLAQDVIRKNGGIARLAIGSTDANIPLSLDLPAICIGLTLGGRAHTKDEFILTEPLKNGLKQLEKIASKIFSDL